MNYCKTNLPKFDKIQLKEKINKCEMERNAMHVVYSYTVFTDRCMYVYDEKK